MVCFRADTRLREGHTSDSFGRRFGLPHFASAGPGSSPPKGFPMRKILLFSLVLILLGAIFVACGDSKKPVVPTATNAFAFMREVPLQGYTFNPVLGQYVMTSNSATFQETIPKDSSTNQPISADFGSLFLDSSGTKVVFDLYGGTTDAPTEQWDVFVGNADGTGLTQITNDSVEDSYPQFSPDGTKVVFGSYREGELGMTDMVVIRNVTNPNSGETVLPMPLGAYDIWNPTFSPDGTSVAVRAYGTNEVNGWFDGIVVMKADGSSAQLITNPYASCDCSDNSPSYTPDGTKIVYTHLDYDASTIDIYSTNADGTGTPTKLTDGIGYNVDPLVVHLSGMADKIIFGSSRDNLNSPATTGFDLYSMNLDGSGLARLTNNQLFDGFSQEWFEPQGTNRPTALVRHAPKGPVHQMQHPMHRLQW